YWCCGTGRTSRSRRWPRRSAARPGPSRARPPEVCRRCDTCSPTRSRRDLATTAGSHAMTELTDILRRALPETEPLLVTRESAVAAGRRAARARRDRLTVVAAAAAAILVVTAAGLLPRASGGSTAFGDPTS